MIRKNDNLRKQINHQIQNVQKQNFSASNHLAHPLLLNIGQYRRQVTSLAINCVKQHNRSSATLTRQKDAKNKSISLAKQNEPIRSVINQSKQLNHTKTTQTKKKKYNYFLGEENLQASLQRTQQAANEQYRGLGLNQLNRISSHEVRNCKSYTFLNKKSDPYITAPFVLDNHQNKPIKNQGQAKNVDKPSQFERVTLSKANRPMSQQHFFKKQRSQTQNNYLTVQNKSSQNLQQYKPQKGSKSIPVPHQQKLTYPKTQTYTSRSEYNIQKLKNKLDSYIKKHINHPL